MLVVDLRGEDRASGHIAGTVHVPAMDLLKQIGTYVEKFRHQPTVAFFASTRHTGLRPWLDAL